MDIYRSPVENVLASLESFIYRLHLSVIQVCNPLRHNSKKAKAAALTHVPNGLGKNLSNVYICQGFKLKLLYT